jgi:lysozyme family protein
MTEQERFDRCLGAVLRFEGGFSDNPHDPGGPTNLGVTLASLSGAWGRAATVAELKALTAEQAGAVYQACYWRAARCSELPEGLDLMVFDAAVNMGPGTAVRLLQTAVGVAADGVFGPRTLEAVGRDPAEQTIAEVARLRIDRYRALAGFAVFGAGWLSRARAAEALALDWRRRAPGGQAAGRRTA